MLVLDYVLLGFIALSVGGILFSLLRKFPRLASLDVDALPQQQQEDIKFSLIEQRLERKMKEGWGKVFEVLRPSYGIIQAMVRMIKRVIAETEKKMKREKALQPKVLTLEGQENARKKIAELLEKGNALVKEEQFAEAEKKFIEVLSFESQNLESYQALGEIYCAQKEWEHAVQVFEHLKKLTPNDAAVMHKLGEVYQALNHPKKAYDVFYRAVELEENNPKYLTSLIEVSIRLRKKVMGVTTLLKLKEVNPENQSIETFDKQIEEI